MGQYKLEVSLPSDTEIILKRKFNAPASLVYHYFADHTTHAQWVGCGMGTVTESTGGPEIGAAWSFRMSMPEYGDCHFFGQCLEAIPGQKFARTFVYNVPEIREHVSVEIATFAETEGVTELSVLIRHLSKESRDAHVASGMEYGATASYDALEALLLEPNGVR